MPKVLDGFMSANEDEDTMTGQLGATLRSGSQTVIVENDEINGPWKWSIDYTKFRGRGKDATENHVGADGIFELSLDQYGRKTSKSLLFQAKMDWSSDKNLLQQAVQLSTWREASIFINYTETAVEALSIDEVLRSGGVRARAKGIISLGEALADYFIQCKIGDTELAYDPVTRMLRWRSAKEGNFVAVRFSIPHRLRLKIKSPSYKHKFFYKDVVHHTEIHEHRMAATPNEVFAPLLTTTVQKQKKQLQSISSAYHPDKLMSLEQPFLDLLNVRMQEFNAAFAHIERESESNI